MLRIADYARATSFLRAGMIALVTALGGPRAAWAEVRYVGGPSASDGAAGTAEAPFATLSKAAAEARPGDTFLVRGGRYSGVFIARGGDSETTRVVFRRDGDIRGSAECRRGYDRC